MKTAIFVISGFLGAGKTTLLKRLLSFTGDLSGTVVLVNEFGKVGIDRDLIKDTAAQDIVELTSGCICCSLKTDMIQTLQVLDYDYSPDRIVIEATGVADPKAISDVLKEGILAKKFYLEKTVTVVDADLWETRESFGTVFKSQLSEADIILLNKTDCVAPDGVPGMLREVKQASTADIVIPTCHCNVDPDLFWSAREPLDHADLTGAFLDTYDPSRDLFSTVHGDKGTSADAAGFITFSFESTQPMDQECFTTFLDNLPLELFRIKGPVRFEDHTQMLNFVGGNSNWQNWPQTKRTRLAFIGWGVVEQQVLKQVENCILPA